jgi:hypothetical protein
MTTLAVLTSMVRNRCNLPAGDSRVTDADITIFINEAIHDAEAEADWFWREQTQVFNTTSGVADYVFPSSLRTTLSLTMDDPARALVKKSWKWTRRLAWPEVTGVPRYYTEYQGRTWLYPVPDEVYAVTRRFLENLNPLQDPGDVVVSPDWFDRIIVTKASSYVAQKLRDSEHYQMFETIYRNQIDSAVDDVYRSVEPMQIHTRDDW